MNQTIRYAVQGLLCVAVAGAALPAAATIVGGNVTSPVSGAAFVKLSVPLANPFGAANSVASVVPQMVKRGSGHLVVISSLAAYRGLPKSAAYCASKAAVSAMFESLRLDLKPHGIDVTIIHPGVIKTPLTARRKANALMEFSRAR